jgi:hypothetical protein
MNENRATLASSPQPERRPYIAQSIESLHEEVKGLVNQVDRLLGSLEPILRADPPKASTSGPAAVAPPGQPRMAASLDEIASLAGAAALRVMDVNSRLEL